MLTLQGVKTLLGLIWKSDKKLTLLLFINNIIRKAVIPLKALVVKEILDIISVGLIESNNTYYKDLFNKQAENYKFSVINDK